MSARALSESSIEAFHAAADAEELGTMRKLLSRHKALLNSHHPEDGYTPLIRTARGGKLRAVEFLLMAGADPLLPETKSPRAIAAHKAAFMGHAEVIGAILGAMDAPQRKRMLETQGPENGKTVLMDAMWIDRPENWPPAYQVAPERVPHYAKLALALIAASRRVGADLTLKNTDGQTALDMARANATRHPAFEAVVEALEAR